MALSVSMGLLVRQKGFGYVLCLETPLPKNTATLRVVLYKPKTVEKVHFLESVN